MRTLLFSLCTNPSESPTSQHERVATGYSSQFDVDYRKTTENLFVNIFIIRLGF